MNIQQIEKKVNGENNLFHSKVELDMFKDSLYSYLHSKYHAAVCVSLVLYEKMFATKLIRETSYPDGFAPAMDNISEQVDYLMKREKNVTIGKNKKKGLGFTDITTQLLNKKLITSQEKDEYDLFYKEYRNPVLHGLTNRLFETQYGRKPASPFEPDTVGDEMHKVISCTVIKKIFGIVSEGRFLKK